MSFWDSWFKPNIEKMKAKRNVKGLVKVLLNKNWLDQKRDYEAYRVAQQALIDIGDARTVELVITVLKNKTDYRDWDVRRDAAYTLGKLGNVSAVEPLISLLKDSDESVRATAITALGQLSDPRAVEPLVTLFEGETKNQETIIVALGQLGDIRAINLLTAALKDKNDTVRTAAAVALVELRDPRVVKPLINARRLQELGNLGTWAVDPFITALKNKDLAVREIAASKLGGFGDARAVKPLITMLKDENRSVRRAAVEALAELGDTRAVEPLIMMLKDEDWTVHRAAAVALGQFGEMQGIFTLIPLIIRDFKKQIGIWADIDFAVKLLEQFSSNLVSQDLKEICELKDYVIYEKWTHRLPDNCAFNLEGVHQQPKDLSMLRQLARQELIRRGEEA